jgi:hypothetical protein
MIKIFIIPFFDGYPENMYQPENFLTGYWKCSRKKRKLLQNKGKMRKKEKEVS